ncbi:MAG: calcium-binding protein [Hellea sp.]
MRRIFEYNFDQLDLTTLDSIILAQKPDDQPLYADIMGDAGDNTLVGTAGNDTIDGLAGNDTLDGLGGTNNLTGGTGADTFIVSARGNHITIIKDFEDGIDFIDLSGMGVSSYDQLVPFMTQNGANLIIDTVWPNSSFERLVIENTTAADLSAADFIFDTDPASRSFTGNALDRTYFGGVGDDSFTGGSGDEDIHGGDGNDFINARLGTNAVYGGEGADTFAVSQRGSQDTILEDFVSGVDVIDLSGIGISSFDQLSPYMTQDGADVTLVTRWGLNIEGLTIANTNLASLTASDFIFDTDATSRNISATGDTFGGLGDDVITAGNNLRSIHGGDGNDTLTGSGANTTLYGGNGNDILSSGEFQYGGNGDDIVYNINSTSLNDGGAGVDLLSFLQTSTGVTVDLGAGMAMQGAFTLASFTGFENLEGTTGSDVLTGDDGDNVISGAAGADRLIGGLGADSLNGGDGFDSVDYRVADARVVVDVLTGGTIGYAAGDTYSGIERYYLSNFNDVITGSSANEFFYGEDGNDTINAGGGIDRLYGGDGDDIQRGQDGNDQLYGSAGNDQLNGGAGFDVANYSFAAAAVTVNMLTGGTGGDAAGDTYFGIEAVYGSDFNDSLTGNNSANELRGDDGDDALFGLGGNDRLFGGDGPDSFDGGTGVDIAMFTVAAAGVTLDLTTGGTGGEAAGDSYTSIEWVFGSDFDDNITGDAANNRLEGRDGNDTLNGEGGNDRLLGGDGNDTINGGDGVDTIFGQDGDDIMSGGADNDFFFGGAGADSHDGGTGTDTVSYLASSSGLTINMSGLGTASTGDAAGDSFVSIERIFGSGHDDNLIGDFNANILIGNGGNDYLAGGGGNDSLNGGAGVDSFGYDEVVDEADVITGFTLNEVIHIFGGTVTDFASLQALGNDAGANVIFDFGLGNTLTIVGHNLADLDAGNFDFSGTPPAGQPLNDMFSDMAAIPSNLDSGETAFLQDFAHDVGLYDFNDADVLL